MKNAPSFTLPDQTGTNHSLADYAGKWLILYFYPQDDTPGCTTEACAFRDDYDLMQQKGLQVLGVSHDSVARHAKFAAKYDLNFPILADVTSETIVAYGAKGLLGTKRMTFLITPAGKIAKEYPKVTPKGHSGQIMADFEMLRAVA